MKNDKSIGQGVIVWITAAIVVGTIIIMISAACVVHHIRMKYTDKPVNTNVVNKNDEETIELNDRSLPRVGVGLKPEGLTAPLIIGKNTEVAVAFIRRDDENCV